MFIFTARLTKERIIAAVVVCGLLLCGLVWLTAKRESDTPAETSGTAPVTQGIKSNTDRMAYLSSLGWKTGAQELQAQEVRIPDTFDDVMTSYNKLQQQHGFDLLKYKGKRVMRYTYEVLNYENGKSGVYAELLIYKNQIIGGDIHNDEQNGFIQGLTGPGACICPSDCTGCLSGCCCEAGCGCEKCKNNAPALSGTEAASAANVSDSGAMTDESLTAQWEEVNDFYDSGAGDEAMVYEDEPAANPDGLPQSPQPDVIEPR